MSPMAIKMSPMVVVVNFSHFFLIAPIIKLACVSGH